MNAPQKLAIGSLWRVNGRTYRVESCWGDEPGFRFVLREVAREGESNRVVKQLARSRRWRESQAMAVVLRKSVMTVDRPWFERRDVEHVGSGRPCELCQGDSTKREGTRCWICNEPSEMGVE